MADLNSLLTSPTGDHFNLQTMTKTTRFDRYEIEIGLNEKGQFLRIVSIKFHKDFTESVKSTNNPDVHDVDKYYKEEE